MDTSLQLECWAVFNWAMKLSDTFGCLGNLLSIVT